MPVIKVITIYAESHLPKKGWLQACIMCEVITSRTKLFITVNKSFQLAYDIHTHICPACREKLKNAKFKLKYNTICQNMIEELDI